MNDSHPVWSYIYTQSEQHSNNPDTKNKVKMFGLDDRDREFFVVCKQKATAGKLAIELFDLLKECYYFLPPEGNVRNKTATLLKSVEG